MRLAITTAAFALLLAMPSAAQDTATDAATAAASPTGNYDELCDTKPRDPAEAWAAMRRGTMLEWGSTYVRYPKHRLPDATDGSKFRLKAWRGERVSAQAVLWTKDGLDNATVTPGRLKGRKGELPSASVTAGFVRYVMTDELNKDGKGGCGFRPDKTQWDSLLVADAIDVGRSLDIEPCSTRPLWLSVRVPHDAAAGTYDGKLTVRDGNGKEVSLSYSIEVLDRTLTAPSYWHLDVDLWQNPYAVARFYGVQLWSNAHFDAMRPIMKMLADAGQQSVTASIMHKPWNGQTYDHFDSMVGKTLLLDGKWQYDYTVFDRWVSFMMDECGIDGRINCYTMIPWDLSFDYYDQATARVKFVKAAPGDEAYKEYWTDFLRDFSDHLREKGWFDKTYISMDERPLEAMTEAIKVIKTADPEYKIALAGNYHEEIQEDLDYLSIPYGQEYPHEVLEQRRQRGQISAYYTCCTEAFPNIFTFSPPAEAAWTALHAVAGDYDGFLRWATMSWPANPLQDSRFHTWAAGDTYCIYPGPMSSLRLENLLQGLQDCEKIHLLRQELQAQGRVEQLAELEDALSAFTPEGMAANGLSTEEAVRAIHDLLNKP